MAGSMRIAVISCATLAVLCACGQTQQHLLPPVNAGATHQTPTAAASPQGTSTPSTSASAATPNAGGAGGTSATTLASKPTIPAAGNYAYTITTNGKASSAQLTVSAAQTSTQGSMDQENWGSSSGGQHGGLDEYLTWESTGVWITEVTGGSGLSSFDCKLTPPALLLQVPLAIGDAWNDNSSCTFNGGSVKWTGSNRIIGTENRQVGSATVGCYVVQASLTITFTSASGTYTITSDGKNWMAPSLGLEVRSDGTTTTNANGQQSTSSSVLQLDSIHPG